MAVLWRLGEFRGESRFTTRAYKLALLDAGGARVRTVRENATWTAMSRRGSRTRRQTDVGAQLSATSQRSAQTMSGEGLPGPISARHRRCALSRCPR
jgi:hypothetical protein